MGRQQLRSSGKKALAALVALLLIAGIAVAGYVFYLGKTFDDKTQKFEQDEVFSGEQPVAEKGDPINFLLLGSDLTWVTCTDAGGAHACDLRR